MYYNPDHVNPEMPAWDIFVMMHEGYELVADEDLRGTNIAYRYFNENTQQWVNALIVDNNNG